MRLYIIRHADPDYEHDTITPRGHLEAKALAKRMHQIGLDVIYASTMGRARDTAAYSARALHLKVRQLPWARELTPFRIDVKPWGKMMSWDLPGELIRNSAPRLGYIEWHDIPHLGASADRKKVRDVVKASDDFLKRLGYQREGGRYRVLRANQKKIAIFCHGGLSLTWLAHLLAIPLHLMWSGFFLAPTSVSTVFFDQRSKKWATPRCAGVGDLSHIYESGLPMPMSGIKANFD